MRLSLQESHRISRETTWQRLGYCWIRRQPARKGTGDVCVRVCVCAWFARTCIQYACQHQKKSFARQGWFYLYTAGAPPPPHPPPHPFVHHDDRNGNVKAMLDPHKYLCETPPQCTALGGGLAPTICGGWFLHAMIMFVIRLIRRLSKVAPLSGTYAGGAGGQSGGGGCHVFFTGRWVVCSGGIAFNLFYGLMSSCQLL